MLRTSTIALIAAGLCGAADAETEDFSLSGTLINGSVAALPAPWTGAATGDDITVDITVELSTPEQSPFDADPNIGAFPNAVTSATVTIQTSGGLVQQSNFISSSIGTTNATPTSQPNDIYALSLVFPGAIVIDVRLTDPTGAALADDGLPSTLTQSDFAIQTFTISPSGNIPEPASLSILAAGLGTMLLRRSRRRS